MKPTIFKFTKSHRGGRANPGIKYDKIQNGDIALIANQTAIIKGTHLTSIGLTIKRAIKKEGNLYYRIFPHTPVTKKPLEVRMGKGKGSVNHYISKVQRGSIILEIKTLNLTKALSTLNIIKSKLPLSSSIIINTLKKSTCL